MKKELVVDGQTVVISAIVVQVNSICVEGCQNDVRLGVSGAHRFVIWNHKRFWLGFEPCIMIWWLR